MQTLVAGGFFFPDSPYNYLVDPGVREIMGINLKDAVVIFDEVNKVGSSLVSLAAPLVACRTPRPRPMPARFVTRTVLTRALTAGGTRSGDRYREFFRFSAS